MKLRVRLNRERQEPAVVEIVADGTATASDVAVAIASVGLDEPLESGRFTLRTDGDYRSTRTLAPETRMAEAGVASGDTVTVVPTRRADVRTTIGAKLRIVSGPDAGVEIALPIGGSMIGRGPECDVRLSDPRVSKRHAKVLVGRQIEVIDENSANGVLLAGQRISRAVVGSGDIVVCGDTQMQITADANLVQTEFATEVRYLRPPVVLSRPREEEIELPEVPSHVQKSKFPWMALLAPVIMGGVMYAFTQNAMTLMMAGLSPILMLGTWIGNLVDGRRRTKLDGANFAKAMEQAEADIAEIRTIEARQLRRLFPSVSQCVNAALNRGDELWSRRPEHPEFLQVRLGSGSIPASAVIKDPRQSGIAELVEQQRELAAKYRLLEDVPVVANLRSVGGAGFAGPTEIVTGVARGAVAQVSVMHSPSEVVIACVTSNAMKAEWRWLEWLPHTASAHSPIPGPLLASDENRARTLLDQLDELIAVRGDLEEPILRGPLAQDDGATAPITPAVLLLVHEAAVATERLASIAQRGPDVGVHVLWVSDQRTGIPASCRTFIEFDSAARATVGMVRSERVIKDVATESLDVETALVAARALAPVVDAAAPISDETDLPRAVSVIGLLGADEATDAAQVLGRWRENGSLVDRAGPVVPRERAGDLRAIVGHAGSEAFTLDLRVQGPHALVGGTTGSGKSEFLQAWVLGMAHAYSPDRVTFLFVDYKGGAAFAKCVELPHNVGLVTDLSPYLVRRALRSLRAEIRRREHLFNDKGVKDLIDFEKTGDPECPPSLIIIVDEFAALVGEVPEFIDGVIDIAQRGRSLGLHLILATQRPAGVIKDSLRANTNLRIALRMNDAHDSSDVLGSAAASTIDPGTPGRGVARVGPGRLIPFQSAFPGARTPAEPPAPPIDVVELDFGHGVAWKIPRPASPGAAVDKDIVRVVDTVAEAARIGKVPIPRRPWLETLSTGYNLMNLNQRSDERIVLGIVDDPDAQSQHAEFFQPDEKGNIVYYGAGGSGKTTALRSLSIAASITPRSGPVHVYGLDFAGGGLGMLESLVNVGSVIAGDDDERIERLMVMLSRMLDERSARFNAVNANSLRDYRKRPAMGNEPRLLVLIDGFGAFRSEYDSGLNRQAVFAQFQRLVNEGRSVGIHFAVTADRGAALPASMQGAFQQRIVLRMADEDAYLGLGVPRDVLGSTSPPGRCMNAERPNEMQLAVLGKDPSPLGQAREISILAESVAAFQKSRPVEILRLPEVVLASEMPVRVNGQPALGMESRSLAPVGFEPKGAHVVAGPPNAGQERAMQWFAESMRRALPEVPRILLSARSTPLAALDVWTAKVSGVDQVKEYLEKKLTPYLVTEAAAGRPSVAIYIDQLPEFAGSPVDSGLAEAVKNVRRNGHLLFGSGETAGFGAFGSTMLAELKGSRAGLLLQPEASDGDLLKVSLPRSRAADFPVGRGYWVRNGAAKQVQIPVVE